MNSNLFKFLENFWEVQNKPKHSLHRVDDEELDLSIANLFYIVTTITVFVVSVFIVAGVVL